MNLDVLEINYSSRDNYSYCFIGRVLRYPRGGVVISFDYFIYKIIIQMISSTEYKIKSHV